MATAQDRAETHEHEGPRYFLEVDEAEYEFDHEPVTGAEIMAKADVPQSVGLVQILEDGTQKAVSPEEDFELKPGRRFKKRPRFKRG